MKNALLILCLLPYLLHAEQVYRWTDAQGKVHFADVPVDSAAESVELKPPSVYSAPLPALSQTAPRSKPVEYNYRVELLTPSQDQTFRDALGIIPVLAQVQPAPKDALVYRFLLDGQSVAETNQPSTELQGVERGAHQVQVILLDAEGRQLASSPVITFYLHQPIAKKKVP